LTLLAWLLPIMTLMAVAFLLALPFTGLAPLWGTRRATGILLAAGVALVLLINAAYQDGAGERTAAAVLRAASALAVVALVPIVGLAAYALALRAAQHGWTPDRIYALAAIVVAAGYAIGYLIALVRSGTALRGLETANRVIAVLIVAVLLSLFTPTADPARLSVADQIARLQSGAIPPAVFDFQFLRFDAGRYGIRALELLATRTDGPQAALIAERAGVALRQEHRVATPVVIVTSTERATNIIVRHHPARCCLRASWTRTGLSPRRNGSCRAA
jgi:hypothetical protein